VLPFPFPHLHLPISLCLAKIAKINIPASVPIRVSIIPKGQRRGGWRVHIACCTGKAEKVVRPAFGVAVEMRWKMCVYPGLVDDEMPSKALMVRDSKGERKSALLGGSKRGRVT
jgi:hypothetical protein